MRLNYDPQMPFHLFPFHVKNKERRMTEGHLKLSPSVFTQIPFYDEIIFFSSEERRIMRKRRLIKFFIEIAFYLEGGEGLFYHADCL